MTKLFNKTMARFYGYTHSNRGMELVQVGILIAIAVGLGLIFKEQITDFIDETFSSLNGSNFGR